MLWQKQIPSRVLGPGEIATISQAYDLALLEIADERLQFQNSPPADIKAKMSLAIMDAFSNGIGDVQMLKIAGISAVATRSLTPQFVPAARSGDVPANLS